MAKRPREGSAAMHCKAIVAKHANAPGSKQVLNIRSEVSAEIQQLVEIALRCALRGM